MAHVLLPCDLPSWPDVQKQLVKLKTCKDGKQVAQLMAKIHETCSISLDPEDSAPLLDHPGFPELSVFAEDVLNSEERARFLGHTMPALAQAAHALGQNKPTNGFLYSLRKEEGSFQLERAFVASLLANAFFSSFPRRNSKTHPTLQDFGMADFFTNLNKRSHQKKLKAFLRYFDKLEDQPKGIINFTRKVVTGPSLPGWLCSDGSLVPLVVRTKGIALEAEARVFRACSCTSLIGGDVLKTSSSQEARLFFAFPELLACLSFVESLGDGEALLVEGVRIHSKQTSHSQCSSFQELSFSLSECPDFSRDPDSQFSDRILLRELNRLLAAFLHTPREGEERRQTPLGESSGEDTRENRRKRSMDVLSEPRKGYLPLIEQKTDFRRSSGSSENRGSFEWQKLPMNKKLSLRNNSQSSGRLSLKTASQSSVELPPIRHTREEEFYTADEDSGEGSEAGGKPSAPQLRREKRASVAMTDLLREESLPDPQRRRRSSSATTASSAAGSVGFVLGGTADSDDEEPGGASAHERLDDFRRRIRKRTRRRLSRRGSSSYAAASSGSSDMEDISEDPEEWDGEGGRTRVLRPASSEPSLCPPPKEALYSSSSGLPPLSPEALLTLGPRKLHLATSSSGRLKAYSYDGGSPNLPVPFRAKFRSRRRHRSQEEGDALPYEALLRERSSSLEDLSSAGSRGRGSRDESMAESEPCSSRCPVAAEACCGDADSQLRSILLWLAASMAKLPALIIYTLQEPLLSELPSVQSSVLGRRWTVGDLSCEVLRFCRNRVSPRYKAGVSPRLFAQLTGSGESSASSLSYNLSQQSLD